MLKNFVSLILSFSLLGVHAQENPDCSATFSLETGELSLPCVTILGNGQEGQKYQVEMQQVAPKEDFHFIVTQTQEVSHPENSENEIPFSVISEGPYGNRMSEYLRESFLAIRNEVRFTSLWQELFPNDQYFYPRPEKPVIDFRQEMVIAVFLGTFSDAEGIRVKVSKIIEKKEQFKEQLRYHTVVLVTITALSPDSHNSYAELSDGHISPYQLIRVRGLYQPIIVNTSIEYSSSWPPE